MLTRNDKVLIFSSLALASFFFIRAFFVSREASTALIKVGDIPVQRVPLKIDRIINIQGEKGKVIIEVKDGRVRAVESSCFQKICVNTGWIDKPGQNIICLPNRVLVIIEGKERAGIDAVSY